MFTMMTTERWAKLYKAQLITLKGGNVQEWGFACLFFDSKFNNILRKKYMQINNITGSWFHIFSFIDPPEQLLSNRLTMLNERYKANEIDYDLYMDLKRELTEIKIRKTTSDQNIDYEREIIREQVIRGYVDELNYESPIDIIVFDLNSLDSSSDSIDAHIINTTFKENDYDGMMKFISKMSKYAKSVYQDDNDLKFERVLAELKNEDVKMATVKIIQDLFNFARNIKGFF